MWQLYALASLFFSSGEYIVDKSALISDTRIHYVVATFWRVALFALCTTIIGMTGLLGVLHFSLSPVLLLFSVSCALASLGYTYLLRRVEITGIAAVSYLAPFLFLAVDMFILKTSLSATEIAGVIVVTLGGFGFAIDGKTFRFKKEFSAIVWGLLFYDIVHTGVEAYLFKYMNEAYNMNAVSFFASTWVPAVAVLLGIVLWQHRGAMLFKRPALVYIPRMLVSKSFDALSSIFWAYALTLAAVSQVSALQALDPLVLFVMTIIAQQILRMRVGEKLGRSRMTWKAVSIGVLVFGGWLIG